MSTSEDAPLEVTATWLPVGGELVAGTGGSTAVLDPATGDVAAGVAATSDEQVDAAVAAAATAFESYGRTTPAERCALVLDIADVIDEHGRELAALESLDVGKPWPSAHDDEMPLTIDTYRLMAGAARTMPDVAGGECVEGHTSMIRRDPVGPIASIAPRNYPLMMAAWKTAAPLAAGCTVVREPPELTPPSTLRLAELLSGVAPPGVANVVHDDGPAVGKRLVDAPAIEALSITGSPATGQAAMRAATEQLCGVHLELGGKAPVIVFDDADVDAVVATIREGSFFDAGRDCAQRCRILVQAGVYDDLVARPATSVGQIRVGHPQGTGTEMGPLVSAEQRARVAGFVDRARDGAEAVVGGDDAGVDAGDDGLFHAPTIVADVDANAEIAAGEVFGPVVSVTRFVDADEAIGAANTSRYGLASSVGTADAGRAMEVTSRLRYGFTWVNTHGVATPQMAWAAMPGSGNGCDMSIFSLEVFAAIRHVMVAHTIGSP